MICDKHCPMLNPDTGECKSDGVCELRDTASICGDCIHNRICGEEGHLDPAMTFCAEKVSINVAGLLSRVRGLRLSDIIPTLEDTRWFTVVRKTGECNNPDTYSHPELFKVYRISFDTEEQKIVVIVEEEKYYE